MSPPTFTERQIRALREIADTQIAFDEARCMSQPPEPELADHQVQRLPIQDGNGVIYPIACRANVVARRCDEPDKACRWVDDSRGSPKAVRCTHCGKYVGEGMARHKLLRSLVDGTYAPTEAPSFDGFVADGITRIASDPANVRRVLSVIGERD